MGKEWTWRCVQCKRCVHIRGTVGNSPARHWLIRPACAMTMNPCGSRKMRVWNLKGVFMGVRGAPAWLWNFRSWCLPAGSEPQRRSHLWGNREVGFVSPAPRPKGLENSVVLEDNTIFSYQRDNGLKLIPLWGLNQLSAGAGHLGWSEGQKGWSALLSMSQSRAVKLSSMNGNLSTVLTTYIF